MKKIFIIVCFIFLSASAAYAVEAAETGYAIGVEDILDINILQPEQLAGQYAVAPDGSISFPYVGNVQVKGLTLAGAQDLLHKKLSDGYMKYPVVTVSLRESRSRKFFVYGEVIRPGSYPLEDNTTVLKAISIAGGFSKYGSSSNVKVLRPNKDKSGYSANKINMAAVMNGNSVEDMLIQPGDVVVVSEGIF